MLFFIEFLLILFYKICSTIQRTYIDLSLDNAWPESSDDDGFTTMSAYSLNYVTMGDGSDGTFYSIGGTPIDAYV